MNRRFAIALVGQDRPGIVSTLTEFLLNAGCNLEDLATSILSGHFAMMLVAAAPENLKLAQTVAALQALGARSGFTAVLWEINADLVTDHPTHVIGLYGRDRPGIVHTIATLLSRLGINICDMSCRLTAADPPLYLVRVEVHVPEALEEAAIEQQVVSTAASLNCHATMRPVEQADL